MPTLISNLGFRTKNSCFKGKTSLSHQELPGQTSKFLVLLNKVWVSWVTNDQEGQKSQNLELEPGTLFLVGSCFLPGSFRFGLPLIAILYVWAQSMVAIW